MLLIQTTGLFKTLLTGPAGILTMVTLMLLEGLLTVPWAQAPDPDLNNDGTVTGKDVSIVARCLGNNPHNKPNCEFNLADLYGVETRILNQSVTRNIDRFPPEFAFQLSQDEFHLISQIVISKSGRGGRRKLPWVFTEHGVAMLPSVLRSKRAIKFNISIIKTFVHMREMLATHKDLARKEEKHDKEIAVLYDSLQKLLAPPKSSKRQIG